MKRKISALVSYFFCWLAYFIFARVLFLVAQFREMKLYTPGVLFQTFIHGSRLDIATTGYIMIIPVLAAIPAVISGRNWYLKFLNIYTGFLVVVFTALVLADAAIYSYWGFRLEFSVLGYMKNPGDAIASASTLQMIFFIALYLLISFAFIRVFRGVNRKFLNDGMKSSRPVPELVVIIILAFSLILPIRGGLGVAPLNAGSVYFSRQLFPNHVAINIIWNFGHTAVYSKPKTNPYIFSGTGEAVNDVRSLLEDNDTTRKVLSIAKPNLLLIIIESFGSYLTDFSGPDTIVTPRFREYIREGIYFRNIYAAGSRTDKAIPAILSGYPNLPLIQVIREPKKTQSMPGIIKLLDSAGYRSSFWYGGDINFANLNSYLTTSGYMEKITRDNFRKEDCNSKWGAHDEVLFNMLQDSLLHFREPFACTVLTLSSHEPFEVPMEKRFGGEDILSKFMNSVYYTDMSLGKFLDKAKTTDWWKHTLVVLLADHCRRNSEKIPVYSEEIFRIPMLWLGGALAEKGTIVTKFGSQFDLPLTLARQLDIRCSFPFSKDLLSKGSKSFSFYTFNDGFAFITDSSKAIYDAKMKGDVLDAGRDALRSRRLGKSFLQVLYDDYLKR
ncbi:MAG TPA: sulfatase-like hydrolase/transferase [Bacteroidales bacterium]|nr:sulfatase-like hydrolase/transferase [Bacteroidales bacterium]